MQTLQGRLPFRGSFEYTEITWEVLKCSWWGQLVLAGHREGALSLQQDGRSLQLQCLHAHVETSEFTPYFRVVKHFLFKCFLFQVLLVKYIHRCSVVVLLSLSEGCCILVTRERNRQKNASTEALERLADLLGLSN